MIKNIRTGEIVKEDYKLGDVSVYFDKYIKLLGKKGKYNGKYNIKRTEDDSVFLDPYSNLFKYNFPSSSSNFNNKKFSII